MPNIFDNFLTQVARGDTIKDYKHASRLFVDNNYELSPKYTWLFHVFFDLNPELTSVDQRQQIEAGMLVKVVDLPKFRIDTKVYNNYNRPHIAQSKMRYEDVNITFYDDSANIVRKLWFDYFSYYYRDMDNNYGDATGSLNPVYLRNNKQVLGQRNLYNKFGYTPRKDSEISTQYIQAIRIYSLHQKRFSEYTLLNPTILSYRHGTHQNGQDGTLENVMTIQYESVLYASGAAKVARGFADLHYDKSPSPLTVAGGGTNSILGPGGIVNALDEVISDGGNGKWGSSAFKAVRAYQTNKNVDFMNLAKGELIQEFTNVLRNGGISNGSRAVNATYIPYRGEQGAGDSQSNLDTQTVPSAGSVASNGLNLTSVAQQISGGISNILSVAGAPLAAATSAISGVISNARGLVTGGDINKVVDLSKTAGDKLVATDSNPIPTNAFTSGIQAANDRIRTLVNQDLSRQSSTVVALPNNQTPTVGVAWQTGSGVVSSAAGALNNTPMRYSQIAASAQAAADIASNNLSSDYSGLSYTGKTSTNAAGSGFVDGNYGSVGP